MERGNGSPQEPAGDSDSDSLEDVRPDIERVDEALAQTGDLPEGSRDDDLSILYRADIDSENERSLSELAEGITEALGRIGLHRADDISLDHLKELGPEILSKLNPYTAESLYFEVFNRMRRWLGGLQYIEPEHIWSYVKAAYRQGLDPDSIHRGQLFTSSRYLQEAGFDEGELLKMITGTDKGKQQNINRLVFYLSKEPRLKKYVDSLTEDADPEYPWRVKQVVMHCQEILQSEIDEIEKQMDIDKNPELSQIVWDSISDERYEKITHRILSSIAIGKLILRTMVGQDPYKDPRHLDI
ncbi:MAG: hypothetical protein WD877_01740 [Candidatus Saccharimonadales bacterium]